MTPKPDDLTRAAAEAPARAWRVSDEAEIAASEAYAQGVGERPFSQRMRAALTAALPYLTADENEDPAVQTIENATRDDVCPGDHITWEESRVYYGVTAFERHEGIAHHRDSYGDWCTEEDGQLTRGEGEGITITIRRPAAQDREGAA